MMLHSCDTGWGRITELAMSDRRIAVASDKGAKMFELVEVENRTED